MGTRPTPLIILRFVVWLKVLPGQYGFGLIAKNRRPMTSQGSSQLPSFIKKEQEKRQQLKKDLFDRVQELTQKGQHVEALSLWNQMTDLDQAA
jgi:hypothetical protein